MLTVLVLVGLLVLGLASLISGIVMLSSGYSDGWGVSAAIGGVLTAAMIIGIPIAFSSQHIQTLALPEQYAAVVASIEQQRELLAVDPSLGTGLEGLEIKNKIADLIEKKENILATVRYINKSPWRLFKVKDILE